MPRQQVSTLGLLCRQVLRQVLAGKAGLVQLGSQRRLAMGPKEEEVGGGRQETRWGLQGGAEEREASWEEVGGQLP